LAEPSWSVEARTFSPAPLMAEAIEASPSLGLTVMVRS